MLTFWPLPVHRPRPLRPWSLVDWWAEPGKQQAGCVCRDGEAQAPGSGDLGPGAWALCVWCVPGGACRVEQHHKQLFRLGLLPPASCLLFLLMGLR